MNSGESTPTPQVRCDSCSQPTPSYEIVHYGSIERGYRQLCGQCFNTEVAKAVGVEGFEHVRFEPVGLADCTGQVHEFHFRTHLFGPGVALEAFELREGHPAGYQFKVIGNSEDDMFVLLGRLIDKMRRALSITHLSDGQLGLQIADHLAVRARIEWDDAQDGRIPLLVIDGREITWEEFGRMLMTFEGWQFKLQIADPSEEL